MSEKKGVKKSRGFGERVNKLSREKVGEEANYSMTLKLTLMTLRRTATCARLRAGVSCCLGLVKPWNLRYVDST